LTARGAPSDAPPDPSGGFSGAPGAAVTAAVVPEAVVPGEAATAAVVPCAAAFGADAHATRSGVAEGRGGGRSAQDTRSAAGGSAG
jgi:hypothetical protein